MPCRRSLKSVVPFLRKNGKGEIEVQRPKIPIETLGEEVRLNTKTTTNTATITNGHHPHHRQEDKMQMDGRHLGKMESEGKETIIIQEAIDTIKIIETIDFKIIRTIITNRGTTLHDWLI